MTAENVILQKQKALDVIHIQFNQFSIHWLYLPICYHYLTYVGATDSALTCLVCPVFSRSYCYTV